MRNNFEQNFQTLGKIREKQVEKIVIEAFSTAGWQIQTVKDGNTPCPDIIVERPDITYLIGIKVSSEGRKDRLIPLWSQTFLQSSCLAGKNKKPLAIVAAPKIAPSVAKQVLEFAAKYAPEAAAGVIDLTGLRMFRGPQLEELNFEENKSSRAFQPTVTSATNLFSDLNQWMLKVLLAPELPNELLSAPRRTYRNASELAEAAKVSKMSAFRLIQQLQHEGFLHESSSHLKLVRREKLFRRWQSAVKPSMKELPLRFIFRSDPLKELKRMSRRNQLCLGLFAAAEALHFGFVSGVPPYVYIPQLNSADVLGWKNIIPVKPNDSPDIILRQPSACQSVFRGMVTVDDLSVCDILQIWLDVSSHPSRGQEQADLIRSRVLAPIIDGETEYE